MKFSKLYRLAKKRKFKEVYFIFSNTVGTILHGEFVDSTSFKIFETPSDGVIDVDSWQKIGGEDLHYVIIPQGIKPKR